MRSKIWEIASIYQGSVGKLFSTDACMWTDSLYHAVRLRAETKLIRDGGDTQSMLRCSTDMSWDDKVGDTPFCRGPKHAHRVSSLLGCRFSRRGGTGNSVLGKVVM